MNELLLSVVNTATWAEMAVAISTMVLALVTAFTIIAALFQLISARRTAETVQKAVRADHSRRRGDATMRATERFIQTYSVQHDALLAIARGEGKVVKDIIVVSKLEGKPMEALHEQLDALEILSVGARLQIYDVNVINHLARCVIIQLWERSTTYRGDLTSGSIDTRRSQPSAFEHSGWLYSELQLKQQNGPSQLDGTMPQID